MRCHRHHVEHGVDHPNATLDVIHHEHRHLVLAQPVVLALLGRRGLLALAFELAEPHVPVRSDEQPIRYCHASGAGELVDQHTFGLGIVADLGFDLLFKHRHSPHARPTPRPASACSGHPCESLGRSRPWCPCA